VVRKTSGRTRVFRLDAREASSLALAEGFELQPKDIVYVAATPLANWNRNLSLLFPGALTSAVSATTRP
jgi:polysaccharide export outer membrane protein